MIHLIHKNKVRYLIGNKITPLPTEPFSKIVCEFLDEISKLIMSDSSPWWVILGDKVDKIQGVVKREKMLEEL